MEVNIISLIIVDIWVVLMTLAIGLQTLLFYKLGKRIDKISDKKGKT